MKGKIISLLLAFFLFTHGLQLFAYKNLGDSDVKTFESKGYILSDKYTTYNECSEFKSQYDKQYSSYKRTDCFGNSNVFQYFICSEDLKCDIVATNTLLSSVAPIKTSSQDTSINTQKLDVILDTLKQNRTKLNDDEKYIEQLDALIVKLKKLEVKYSGKKSQKMATYLLNGVTNIKNDVLNDSEESNFFCELMGNCDKKSEATTVVSQTKSQASTLPNQGKGCAITNTSKIILKDGKYDGASLGTASQILGLKGTQESCIAWCDSVKGNFGEQGMYCHYDGNQVKNYVINTITNTTTSVNNKPTPVVEQVGKGCAITNTSKIILKDGKYDGASLGTASQILGLKGTQESCIASCDSVKGNFGEQGMYCHYDGNQVKNYITNTITNTTTSVNNKPTPVVEQVGKGCAITNTSKIILKDGKYDGASLGTASQILGLKGTQESCIAWCDSVKGNFGEQGMYCHYNGNQVKNYVTNTILSNNTNAVSTMSDTDIRKKQINALYKEVLGRYADVKGLEFYVNSGKSLIQIKAELLSSDEYKKRQTTSYTSPVSQQNTTYTAPQQVVTPVAPTQPVVPSSPVRIGGGSCSETQHTNGYYCDSWNFSGVGVGGSLCSSGVAKNHIYGRSGLISYDCYDR